MISIECKLEGRSINMVLLAVRPLLVHAGNTPTLIGLNQGADLLNARYNQNFFVSWEELHRDTRILCQALLEQETRWNGIIAITRGGLIPAAIVARELDIRLIDTVCAVSYAGQEGRQQNEEVQILKRADGDGDGEGMLLIDDLVDTGQTASLIRRMLPRAFFAAVYAKPEGRPLVDLCVREVTQDTWIRFPWDMALGFAVPLVERAERD